VLYREAGHFKTSYAADQAMFPIREDRIWMALVLIVAFVAVPLLASDYLLVSILLPFLIFSIAAIGLNILTGYCGQLSLGTGGFMACGALAAYKIASDFPGLNIVLVFLLAGGATACVGVLFGLPSVRIKGFYLAVATLAAQFFLVWLFPRVARVWSGEASGSISAPPRAIFGDVMVSGINASAVTRYLFTLSLVVVLAIAAKNLVRSRIGRAWMAIRDMDIAAEIIGIRPLRTKLIAFAVSSFYCGIAGALWAFVYLAQLEASAFDIDRSFRILFMIIIGGLGSILGSFLGAAFVSIMPIFLNVAPTWLGFQLSTTTITNTEFILFGSLIIIFLIAEPHGLARLWGIAKEKLRIWPFPH
jgi:branched-chain amino acid transport system permease protein